MPTTYTHYRFGKDVISSIPDTIQNTINEHREAFNIGLHGPDLLFYHNPLSSNEVSSIGYRMHDEPGTVFFTKAADTLKQLNGDCSASLAYIYGFICHFALDSICHPYVEELCEIGPISHSELEAEFDRVLLEKDGFDPLSHKVTGHITSGSETVNAIAPFFPEVSKRQIKTTLKSMKFFLDILVAPNGAKRNLINTVLKISGNYESLHTLLMNLEPNPECEKSNQRLMGLYQQSIPLAIRLITNFDAYLNDAAPLDNAFQHTFGKD